MIASLDCISKLISHSFFIDSESYGDDTPSSPPPSPAARRTSSSSNRQPASLVDLVAHTITACHTETTPDTVSLQIVKALLSLVLSSTLLVHQSSLLKAIRTVYNIFLLSPDPVNQTVAQGGLTQMVHHVFSRCKLDILQSESGDNSTSHSKEDDTRSRTPSKRPSLTPSTPETVPLHPLTPPNGAHAGQEPSTTPPEHQNKVAQDVYAEMDGTTARSSIESTQTADKSEQSREVKKSKAESPHRSPRPRPATLLVV